MNKNAKGILSRRSREINNRLDKLTSDDVRLFFYESGYYPESQYLPSDFFNTGQLSNTVNSKKIEKLNSSHKTSEKPSFLFFPKSKFTLRALAIPPLSNYLILANFIAENWDNLKAHLKLDKDDRIIPYSYPLFYEDKNRSGIGIENYKIFADLDLPSLSAQYSHCIFLDIKNFYPSIYTHALAWALDPNTVFSDSCGCTGRSKCASHHRDYWPNRFDELNRYLDRNRTKGLLVGPLTSDLASEVLLKTIDKKISKFALDKKIDFIGLRFKDDYALMTNGYENADCLRKEIQMLLSEFHLDVNENKTRISATDDLEDKKEWKVEVEKIKNEIDSVFTENNSAGSVFLTEKQIRFWFKKANNLYKQTEDVYILKAVLGRLIKKDITSIVLRKEITNSIPHQINLEEVYVSVFAYLSLICKKEPSTWPQFIAFMCLCYEGTGSKAIKSSIKDLFETYTLSFLENDTFSLIWTLWGVWRCKVSLTARTQTKVRTKYQDNWLVLALLDKKSHKVKIDGNTYEVVNSGVAKPTPLFKVISIFSYADKAKKPGT